MRSFMQTLWHIWLSMHLSSWGFLTKHQKMSVPLGRTIDDQYKEEGPQKGVLLFKGDA